MNSGDLIEFKRKGFVARVLGGILKLFERKWDAWGWHVGIAWQRSHGGWYILEAVARGVTINFYSFAFLAENTRFHTWLEETPRDDAMKAFFQEYIGKRYDVAIYFWTALQYLIRHFFNRRIPRLLDDRFTCWELAAAFFDYMGKPVHSKYDCPMLPDILANISQEITGMND
jgi:hypothetical protein